MMAILFGMGNQRGTWMAFLLLFTLMCRDQWNDFGLSSGVCERDMGMVSFVSRSFFFVDSGFWVLFVFPA